MKKFIIPTLIFALACAIALYNIGNFPKMIGDEGIYVSQAYWIAHFGKLGPYTYWYDHSPLGWLQIGLWQLITGTTGFLSYTVLSARILMGIVLGSTTALIYILTNQITKSKLHSLIASSLFITSALTLTFGRMVLLDNLAIFWFLLSLILLFLNPTRLKYLIFSSLTMSLAILTKESLLFFVPPYLFAIYHLNKANQHKRYALLVSFCTLFFILSFFPLLAVLKNELLPSSNQVSFFGTLLFQAGRGSGIPFWEAGSHFSQMLKMWTSIDPILVILGGLSFVLTLLLPIEFRGKLISTFSLFFLLFLIRGGQIYEFYVIPLIPLLAIDISLLLDYFSKVSKTKFLSVFFLIASLVYAGSESRYPFTSLSTSPQKQSIEELKLLPENSTIVANNYAYLDLYLQNKNKIEWYQKIESDPETQKNAGKITHILVDVQFRNELDANLLPYLKNELNRQSSSKKFGPLLAPGENVKPFSTENLTLYTLAENSKTYDYVVSLDEADDVVLNMLAEAKPFGVMLSKSNFNSSSDLEIYLQKLKSILNPTTEIIVTQDDTGTNTIPWITSLSRTFYKSREEAVDATSRKTDALKKLGFTAAIITSSTNTDGFLNAITQSAQINLNPIIRFDGNTPESNLTLITNSKSDLEILEKSGYRGQILYLTSVKNYLENR